MWNQRKGVSLRFSFGLRALFGAVTVVALVVGWNLNVIRQRHQLIAEQRRLLGDELRWMTDEQHVPAPWRLRLFGESGWQTISLILPKGASKEQYLEKARRLFPEAEFIDVVGEQLSTGGDLEELRRQVDKEGPG